MGASSVLLSNVQKLQSGQLMTMALKSLIIRVTSGSIIFIKERSSVLYLHFDWVRILNVFMYELRIYRVGLCFIYLSLGYIKPFSD